MIPDLSTERLRALLAQARQPDEYDTAGGTLRDLGEALARELLAERTMTDRACQMFGLAEQQRDAAREASQRDLELRRQAESERDAAQAEALEEAADACLSGMVTAESQRWAAWLRERAAQIREAGKGGA